MSKPEGTEQLRDLITTLADMIEQSHQRQAAALELMRRCLDQHERLTTSEAIRHNHGQSGRATP